MRVRTLTIPILIFVLSISGVSAQVDYLKLRDRYQLSCRIVDSVELQEAKVFYDSMAPGFWNFIVIIRFYII